jgi:hypothetical protein
MDPRDEMFAVMGLVARDGGKSFVPGCSVPARETSRKCLDPSKFERKDEKEQLASVCFCFVLDYLSYTPNPAIYLKTTVKPTTPQT